MTALISSSPRPPRTLRHEARRDWPLRIAEFGREEVVAGAQVGDDPVDAFERQCSLIVADDLHARADGRHADGVGRVVAADEQRSLTGEDLAGQERARLQGLQPGLKAATRRGGTAVRAGTSVSAGHCGILEQGVA
jgi:hypothetical protein